MAKKGYTIWFDGDEEHQRVKQNALTNGISMREELLSGRYSDGFAEGGETRTAVIVDESLPDNEIRMRTATSEVKVVLDDSEPLEDKTEDIGDVDFF